MWIIVEKEKKYVLEIGESFNPWENGYPSLDGIKGYVPELYEAFNIEKYPEDDITKYCYTPVDGFYLKPKEEKEYNISNEEYNEIKDKAIDEVYEVLSNGN